MHSPSPKQVPLSTQSVGLRVPVVLQRVGHSEYIARVDPSAYVLSRLIDSAAEGIKRAIKGEC